MELDTRRYYEIIDEFKKHWPTEIDKVDRAAPMSGTSIRLTMKDGRKYDYTINGHYMMPVVEYDRSERDEITDENCRESFSRHLVNRMHEKGFTQDSLSEYTGLSKGSINNYIKQKATPSGTAMRKIAHALRCTLNDLMD